MKISFENFKVYHGVNNVKQHIIQIAIIKLQFSLINKLFVNFCCFDDLRCFARTLSYVKHNAF